MTISCCQCQHYDQSQAEPPSAKPRAHWGFCTAANQVEAGQPLMVADPEDSPASANPDLRLYTAPSFSCDAAIAKPDYAQPEPWHREVNAVREKLAELPEQLHRFQELLTLHANMRIYAEALESAIIGMDPDDPYPQPLFGDAPMADTIRILQSLPTMPAIISAAADTA